MDSEKDLDSPTISDDPTEIAKAAKAMKVSKTAIHAAKQYAGTNNRKKVYEWIEAHRGQTVGILI